MNDDTLTLVFDAGKAAAHTDTPWQEAWKALKTSRGWTTCDVVIRATLEESFYNGYQTEKERMQQ